MFAVLVNFYILISYLKYMIGIQLDPKIQVLDSTRYSDLFTSARLYFVSQCLTGKKEPLLRSSEVLCVSRCLLPLKECEFVLGASNSTWESASSI